MLHEFFDYSPTAGCIGHVNLAMRRSYVQNYGDSRLPRNTGVISIRRLDFVHEIQFPRVAIRRDQSRRIVVALNDPTLR
jgi:hypothetical protein